MKPIKRILLMTILPPVLGALVYYGAFSAAAVLTAETAIGSVLFWLLVLLPLFILGGLLIAAIPSFICG